MYQQRKAVEIKDGGKRRRSRRSPYRKNILIYDGDINKRPKRFLVEYKVGNEPTIQKIFNN